MAGSAAERAIQFSRHPHPTIRIQDGAQIVLGAIRLRRLWDRRDGPRRKEHPLRTHRHRHGNKDHKTPEYMTKHPFGQGPMFHWDSQDDDGSVLYESRAICRYLAEKYAGHGTPLIPTGLRKKALFEQAISIEWANFLPSVMKVGIESLSKQSEAMSEFSAKLDVYK
ncbi:hypothetical protein C8R44DRAFT_909645 [Mycena epipterygia]|nr:hypothetical protein C8R44DRAFT_909645 [Mycena epipterygia]